MKSKKTLIVISSIVLVAIIVIIIIAVRRKKKVENPAGAKTSTTTTGLGDSFPLREGSNGNNVSFLQSNLRRVIPPYTLSVDGIFGKNTLAALNEALGTSVISKKQFEKLNSVTWSGNHQMYYTPLTDSEKLSILQA